MFFYRNQFVDEKTGVTIHAPQEGSLIHGTLCTPHLVAAFADAVRDTPEYAGMLASSGHPIHRALNLLTEQDESDQFWHTDEACWLLEELEDILETYAPEGTIFATHIGDGSDFGYWPAEFYD